MRLASFRGSAAQLRVPGLGGDHAHVVEAVGMVRPDAEVLEEAVADFASTELEAAERLV